MFSFMHTNMNFFHGFGMLIFWAIIVFLIFSLVSNKDTNNEDKLSALELLKKKFVNGEISEEEYNSKKKVLEGKI